MPESASFAELFVRGIGVGNVCGAVGDLAAKSSPPGPAAKFFPSLATRATTRRSGSSAQEMQTCSPKSPPFFCPMRRGGLTSESPPPLKDRGKQISSACITPDGRRLSSKPPSKRKPLAHMEVSPKLHATSFRTFANRVSAKKATKKLQPSFDVRLGSVSSGSCCGEERPRANFATAPPSSRPCFAVSDNLICLQ